MNPFNFPNKFTSKTAITWLGEVFHLLSADELFDYGCLQVNKVKLHDNGVLFNHEQFRR